MLRPIFDSHLDLAWNALTWKRDITLPLSEINAREDGSTDSVARGRATTSLPEMRRGRIMMCLGTLMARVPHGNKPVLFGDTLDFPSRALAWSFAQGQLAYYRMLEQQGEIQFLRNAGDLGEHWRDVKAHSHSTENDSPIGLILAMEGADAIMSPDQVDQWWAEGLRCVSLVHYGVSAYAHGTGEEGPLTDSGRELLKEMERVGMILDVTHLSDTSFDETVEHYSGPLIASHQNCRALVPGQRQFSDSQIQCVIDRGGILGIAFDAWMLYPDWKRPTLTDPGTSYEVVSLADSANHIDHICQLAGNTNHVAIGSDLDGGFGNEQTPCDLRSIADIQKLNEILSERGYSDEDIDRIFHGNYLHFFMENLP